MKRISFMLAALFCLAACDKQEVPAIQQDNQEDVYEIVLNTLETKGSAPASVELQMGGKESQTLTATLLKNNEPVNGATFTWNDPETGGYYSGKDLDTQTTRYRHEVTAIKPGSGSSVSVTGYDGGKARATSPDIPINVAAAAEHDYSITINYKPTLWSVLNNMPGYTPPDDVTFVIAAGSTTLFSTDLSYNSSSSFEVPASIFVENAGNIVFKIYGSSWKPSPTSVPFDPFGKTSKKCSNSTVKVYKGSVLHQTDTNEFYGSGWNEIYSSTLSGSFFDAENISISIDIFYNNNQDPR